MELLQVSAVIEEVKREPAEAIAAQVPVRTHTYTHSFSLKLKERKKERIDMDCGQTTLSRANCFPKLT